MEVYCFYHNVSHIAPILLMGHCDHDSPQLRVPNCAIAHCRLLPATLMQSA